MKTKFSTILGTALLTTGLASTLISAPAQAAPPAKGGSSGGSSTPTVQCNISNVSIGNVLATACSGPFAGNDTGAGKPLETKLDNGLFASYVGSGDWWEVGKSDSSDNYGVEANNGSNNSWWKLGKALPSNTFVVSLKTSTYYSAYLFKNYDFSKGLTGVFNTIGVDLDGSGTKGRGLSHLSVFALNVVTPPPEKKIPEPATMMGLGVVASALLIRRRKSH